MSFAPTRQIADLNQIHGELDLLFFDHQVAILKDNRPLARTLFQAYGAALKGHLKEEEEILLPLYRERAGPQRGGDPEIFVQEHQKIMEWLDRLGLRLSRLSHLALPRDVIALLDDEAQFKQFLHHHSLREDRIFYPALERVTSVSEKTALLRLLTFSLDSFDEEIQLPRGRSL